MCDCPVCHLPAVCQWVTVRQTVLVLNNKTYGNKFFLLVRLKMANLM